MAGRDEKRRGEGVGGEEGDARRRGGRDESGGGEAGSWYRGGLDGGIG